MLQIKDTEVALVIYNPYISPLTEYLTSICLVVSKQCRFSEAGQLISMACEIFSKDTFATRGYQLPPARMSLYTCLDLYHQNK